MPWNNLWKKANIIYANVKPETSIVTKNIEHIYPNTYSSTILELVTAGQTYIFASKIIMTNNKIWAKNEEFDTTKNIFSTEHSCKLRFNSCFSFQETKAMNYKFLNRN
jgi:hypothetical protein